VKQPKKNPCQLLTIDNGLTYQNLKVLNGYKDEQESFRKDSKSFNNKSNDEKVDYQNAAYLKDRGIYPISFLFVENAGSAGYNQTKTKSHSCVICSNKISDIYQWQEPASSDACYENREFSQKYLHIVHQNCSSVKFPKKLEFF